MTTKALSLWQPWAYLVVTGQKKIETRSWETKYRGPLVIHAAKKNDSIVKNAIEELREMEFDIPDDLNYGFLIGSVVLKEADEMTDKMCEAIAYNNPKEHLAGDYRPGRFAWYLKNPKRFKKPKPYRAFQRLFNVPFTLKSQSR